ncbi:MAG: alpha/beta hydrolase [Myxococcaceae bacterium]|nr:alpha/beta hydrolase [Myxococcaceae bacterium]
MLSLKSGTLRSRRHGPESAPLAIGVPGLSANALTFDAVGASLAAAGLGFAALDLRGRGRSPAGAHGTHGWENHARDVIAAATDLAGSASTPFDLVGHSMGAFVGLVAANFAPQRVRRLVLIDAVGIPDPRAMPPIIAAVSRLGAVHESADTFFAKISAAGVVPWSPFWEAHYREDLVDVPGGVQQRASPAAVLEDLHYGTWQLGIRNLWPGIKAKALLIRAALPIGYGFIVTTRDRDAFLESVPGSRCVEVPANHYGVMNHPETTRAVVEFLK